MFGSRPVSRGENGSATGFVGNTRRPASAGVRRGARGGAASALRAGSAQSRLGALNRSPANSSALRTADTSGARQVSFSESPAQPAQRERPATASPAGARRRADGGKASKAPAAARPRPQSAAGYRLAAAEDASGAQQPQRPGSALAMRRSGFRGRGSPTAFKAKRRAGSAAAQVLGRGVAGSAVLRSARGGSSAARPGGRGRGRAAPGVGGSGIGEGLLSLIDEAGGVGLRRGGGGARAAGGDYSEEFSAVAGVPKQTVDYFLQWVRTCVSVRLRRVMVVWWLQMQDVTAPGPNTPKLSDYFDGHTFADLLANMCVSPLHSLDVFSRSHVPFALLGSPRTPQS